jgi:hypothetical protein
MSQLHEVLAAENDIENQWKIINEETLHILTKPQMFMGKVTRLTMTKPSMDEPTKAATEAAGSAVEAIGTTVTDRLNYTGNFFTRLINHRLQKDRANQEAVADIIIDGVTIATKLPATFLLDLEERLAGYRAIYAGIPTLDVKKEWSIDEKQGKEIYKTVHPEVRSKTEKTIEHKIIVPATDKHPAQVKEWPTDNVVGKTEVIEFSGMWTSARKATVLNRCDKLIVAVKEARARANQTVVKSLQDIGSELLKYIEATEVKA